ncbi:MAG: N-acetyltransferase [Solirubrobacteraceae bacterium]|nr:N-acetyltransferase [Solirubrobacteraceae bacterium]
MRLTDGVVALRHWREDDVEACVRGTNDPEVVRWTRVPENNTAAMAREHLFAEDEHEMRLAVADAATDELLGAVSLLRVDAENRRAELGYWVAAEHRGRGVAVRAVALMAAWAFAERGLARLELHIDLENAASRRVAEKAGFAFEGVLRGYEEIKGRRVDVAMHARLAG